jgi:uncharacterized protein
MSKRSVSATALVTGASSGIGEAIAREYARRGIGLVLVARRRDRLVALSAQLASSVPVSVIVEDLADAGAPARIADQLARDGIEVDILVNNAGYGVPGRFLSSDWKIHADFLQVMVGAVAELTHRLLPGMEARGRGGVLNVASVAGLVPGSAGHTMYGAVKSWMIRFSESLSLECAPRGVNVTALCPGFTYSEFHDVTGTRAQVSRMSRRMWLQADDVARAGIDALQAGVPMCIPGWRYRLIRQLAKHLPDGVARRIIGRRSKDFRDDS